MLKKKKTLNQLEYEKALKNLKRRIKAAEKGVFDLINQNYSRLKSRNELQKRELKASKN